MAKKNNDRLDELCKMLSEKTGMNIRWAGSNGEYCCVGDNPFNFLHGYHTKRDTILYIEGLLGGIDFMRRQHGMTIRELSNQIAAFTGDKKSEAMRKARIFRHNCCVSLTKVTDVRLSYGKRTMNDGTERVDRGTLNFRYRDNDGDGHFFSIIE